MNEPAWEHDCELDVFLGTRKYEGEPVDLYYHDHTPMGPGLIARFSSEDSDNHTWSISQGEPPKELPWFYDAFHIAVDRIGV